MRSTGAAENDGVAAVDGAGGEAPAAPVANMPEQILPARWIPVFAEPAPALIPASRANRRPPAAIPERGASLYLDPADAVAEVGDEVVIGAVADWLRHPRAMRR